MELSAEQQIAEIWKLLKETDMIVKETSLQMKETDRKFKETDKKIKALSELFTGQWGKLIEALVEPGALQLFRDRGINVNHILRRMESQKNGRQMETDLLLTNDTELVAIEVKTTLKVEDVRELLNDLEHFLDFFPFYKNFKIYGAVASINIEENADKFAYRQGLFVLKGGKEGLITILNDEKFRPKNFSTQSA
jgi:hypothetical protein